MSVKPIPDGYHSLTPYMAIDGAAAAMDFYKAAFGAEERYRMAGPDGKIMHAEMKIGTSIFMLSDANAEWDHHSPKHYGGSPISFYLYVKDCDAAFAQALAAGGTETRPLKDAFYGDRSGSLKDPFGFSWTIGTHIKDMTEEEIAAAAQAHCG